LIDIGMLVGTLMGIGYTYTVGRSDVLRPSATMLHSARFATLPNRSPKRGDHRSGTGNRRQ
jgi:hypothetical protein